MARPLKYLTTLLVIPLIANCAGFPYKKPPTKKELFIDHASMIPVTDTSGLLKALITTVMQSENDSIRHNLRSILGIICLLFIWLSYRIRINIAQRKKPLKLDEQEMALLHVASDTLSNLLYRLKQKTRSKIIPFPRSN